MSTSPTFNSIARILENDFHVEANLVAPQTALTDRKSVV